VRRRAVLINGWGHELSVKQRNLTWQCEQEACDVQKDEEHPEVQEVVPRSAMDESEGNGG
jgi:hypothetical protein